MGVYSLFWAGVSLPVYLYIHPWATIIPFWFAVSSVGSFL